MAKRFNFKVIDERKNLIDGRPELAATVEVFKGSVSQGTVEVIGYTDEDSFKEKVKAAAQALRARKPVELALEPGPIAADFVADLEDVEVLP